MWIWVLVHKIPYLNGEAGVITPDTCQSPSMGNGAQGNGWSIRQKPEHGHGSEHAGVSRGHKNIWSVSKNLSGQQGCGTDQMEVSGQHGRGTDQMEVQKTTQARVKGASKGHGDTILSAQAHGLGSTQAKGVGTKRNCAGQ